MLTVETWPVDRLIADAAGAWQRDLVGALFGAYDAATDIRHVREFFCLVPKKSSKTTTGAAIMITALLMNRRPRAEFLLVAPTQEVADLAFRQAAGMVEADPVLAAKFHVVEHIKRITYRPSKAFLKVKSFDPKVVTGSKPSGVLLDELHVIAEAHDADRVIGQLRGGLLPNPEGFLLTITTQSERPPSGVFRTELLKARKVRDGAATLPILPMLYEFPDGVDWRDPANWWMVLPNNGLSVSVDRLLPDYEAAVESGDAELARWASQHLNVEIGLALKSDRWRGADHWLGATDTTLTLETLLARSEVVTIGIDGGRVGQRGRIGRGVHQPDRGETDRGGPQHQGRAVLARPPSVDVVGGRSRHFLDQPVVEQGAHNLRPGDGGKAWRTNQIVIAGRSLFQHGAGGVGKLDRGLRHDRVSWGRRATTALLRPGAPPAAPGRGHRGERSVRPRETR